MTIIPSAAFYVSYPTLEPLSPKQSNTEILEVRVARDPVVPALLS